jgi:hypothetical protein
MEWRKCYLDVILVPLGVLINIAYRASLWHKVRTQPLTTIIGTYSKAQRLWVPGTYSKAQLHRQTPFFFLSFFLFFFSKRHRFWGAFFKLIFFSKGHFSNLTPKNEVVLYFPSNLTVLTNGWGLNITVW